MIDRKYDMICIGTALVDSIVRGFDPKPVSASGYTAVSGVLSPGGEAVNEAMAAAKLGKKAAILCYLGDDAAGDLVYGALEKCGVHTELIRREPEHSTPVTTMFVREGGGRMSVTNLSHKYNFHPEKDLSCFDDSASIIVGSLFRAPFDDPDIIYQVISAAKRRGLIVFADTKIPNFRPLGLDDIAGSLPMIDYITPNEDEGKYYTGKSDPEEIADVFLSYGIKNVIVKLGSKGCLFKNKNELIRLPAHAIKAVDSTGAGDNFIAGFASEIISGRSVRDALVFANACGAICTTAAGAGTALKDRAQVLELASSCF